VTGEAATARVRSGEWGLDAIALGRLASVSRSLALAQLPAGRENSLFSFCLLVAFIVYSEKMLNISCYIGGV
jgi:hypothetical protein